MSIICGCKKFAKTHCFSKKISVVMWRKVANVAPCPSGAGGTLLVCCCHHTSVPFDSCPSLLRPSTSCALVVIVCPPTQVRWLTAHLPQPHLPCVLPLPPLAALQWLPVAHWVHGQEQQCDNDGGTVGATPLARAPPSVMPPASPSQEKWLMSRLVSTPGLLVKPTSGGDPFFAASSNSKESPDLQFVRHVPLDEQG